MDNVEHLKISTTVLQRVSPDCANYYRVSPVELTNNELLLYADDVGKDKKEELQVVLGCQINLLMRYFDKVIIRIEIKIC